MLRKQQQRKVDYTATQLLLQRMRIMKEEANPIIIIIIAITTPALLKPEEKKAKSDRDHMLVISNPKWTIFLPQILPKSCTNSSHSRDQSREPPERASARARKDRSIDDIHSYNPSVATSISTSITTSITALLCECIHPRIVSISVGVVRQSRNQISSIPSSSSPLQNIHS